MYFCMYALLSDKDIDGMSMWEAISTFGPSPRTEFIYNLDNSSLPLQGHAAIRYGLDLSVL